MTALTLWLIVIVGLNDYLNLKSANDLSELGVNGYPLIIATLATLATFATFRAISKSANR